MTYDGHVLDNRILDLVLLARVQGADVVALRGRADDSADAVSDVKEAGHGVPAMLADFQGV